MTPKQTYNNHLADRLIKKFNKRRMEAFYVKTKEEAKNKVLELIPENSSITWGGTETMIEAGIIDALKNGNYICRDRTDVAPEDIYDFYIDVLKSDFYLMSANAVTEDGELVNIDGRGNRVMSLILGPKNVIVVVSLNKVVKDRESAIERARTYAAPMNGIRLDITAPCAKTGVCYDCNTDDCMCSHIVITRNSKDQNRIKIILVEEELGL